MNLRNLWKKLRDSTDWDEKAVDFFKRKPLVSPIPRDQVIGRQPSKFTQGIGRVKQAFRDRPQQFNIFSPKTFGPLAGRGAKSLSNIADWMATQQQIPEMPGKWDDRARSLSRFGTRSVRTMAKGLEDISGATKRGGIVGAGQFVRGMSRTVTPFVPWGVGSNIMASIDKPLEEKDRLRRAGAGIYSAMASDDSDELTKDVPRKTVNILGNEVDLVRGAGKMFGFVQNPANKQLFKLTEMILPSKGLALKQWLKTTGFRGAMEDIFLSLADMPENASPVDKMEFILKNAAFGAASEIAFGGGMELLQRGGKKALSELPKAVQDSLVNIFDDLKEIYRRANTPVTTMKFDKDGKRITMPMWQYKLRNQPFGLGVKDINELSVREYGKIKEPKIPKQLEGLAEEARKYKSAKKRIAELDRKIVSEQKRLNKIAPDRPVFGGGAGIRDLSERDMREYARLNDFISRYENKVLGDPAQRIETKRKLAGAGIKFDADAPLQQLTDIYNQATKATVKGRLPEKQTAKILQPQTEALPTTLKVLQTPPGKVLTKDSSLEPIISDKYAFNINKPKLGLKGEAAAKLDATVEKMRPVLERRKGKPMTDAEIIKGGRKAKLLEQVMGREQSKQFADSLQASRNFLRTQAKKKGLTPEFLAQLEIISSHAADKGRSLRAFAVRAEDAGIKESVVRDLQKLGIQTKRLIEASKNVDWDDAAQVTAFYRKFKPASFLEKLDEYRYVNMLSSPNTHENNMFSNFLQTAVVTPIEKTVAGGIDFVKSRLTGSERKYFASQGVDYTKGYWKALPEAWSKFKNVAGGEGGLRKPDIDFIPTSTSKWHKIYTTPLRLLEASDQFFKTLTSSGERVAGATAKQAERTAEYRLFRQKFDPEGKLGQGGLLKLWDKWNSGVQTLRSKPGGKWIVPFLQTPTNILKQGVEYSPLGVATIPGSKEPINQLAKTMIGTAVFTGAYALADAGLTTWDAPTNKKERERFYAAGIQPYSVKIGDKWVSYSKLGPMSYPIAMAAAMKWAKDNGADDSFLKRLGAGAGGFMQFFADQSYMRGIGDVIDAIRGDEFKQGRALANIPSQLIPYRALQGWFARLVDPIYRKTTGGGVGEQMIKSIKSQIPFVSKTLEPYTTPSGEPSPRQYPVINALSPLKISKETNRFSPSGQTTIKTSLPTDIKQLKILYEDANKTIKGYAEKKTKAQYGLVDKDLSEYQAEFDTANALLKRIKSEQPEKVFEIETEVYSKKGSMDTESRVEWTTKQLENLKGNEYKTMYKKLVDKGVITKSVAEGLREVGLDANEYSYGGKTRFLGKKGGKGRKTRITIKTPTASFKPTFRKSRPFQLSDIPTVRLKSGPIKAGRVHVPKLRY